MRPLGGGGMKQVYLADDIRLANRPCALAEMIDSFANPKDRQTAVPSMTSIFPSLVALHFAESTFSLGCHGLPKAVCGEFQFRRQPGSERGRCSVGASDMNRGVRSEVKRHRFSELA